eukprot:6175781-Pleurochrysis_carterae.AAC.2
MLHYNRQYRPLVLNALRVYAPSLRACCRIRAWHLVTPFLCGCRSLFTSALTARSWCCVVVHACDRDGSTQA